VGDELAAPSVRLLRTHGSEEELLAALLYEASTVGEEQALAAVAGLSADERTELVRDLVATRENRRHRPGRGFETLTYRFEIVSDYGAFRDLQRHRLLTCQWQRLSPDLGADIPHEVEEAGLGPSYARALETSRAEYERLRVEGLAEEAPYALCLAYRIRYVLELDAREALHLIELRSGREGHPSYRAVALQMREAIAAVHPSVAAAMTFVDDSTEPRLERLLSEMRNEARAGR
jgi:thymidylate synthase ThyX